MKGKIGKALIGAGWHRCVFPYKNNPSLVVKIMHRHLSNRRNRMEWEIWNNAPENIKKWLAPCVSISDDGMYLVQQRGDPVGDIPKDRPKEFFLYDMGAPENWVEINGKVLLADYSNNYMYRRYGKKDNV